MTTTPKPVTPPDPSRGICPTCGLYAKLPEPDPDTMHRAQIAVHGRAQG